MTTTTNILLPDEFKNAPDEIREQYILWYEYGQQLDNHELRYYSVPDKHGEEILLDCKGIAAANIKKVKRLGGYTKAVEEEIRRRSSILHSLKTLKGNCAARYNFWLNGSVRKNQNILEIKKEDVLEQFGNYKSIEQVLNIVKEWGYATNKNALTEFYYNHLDDIQDRRIRFQAQEKDYYLSTGTGRIESLSYLFTELMKLFEESKHVKYSAELRAIIEQVRKEVKGDEIRLTVDGKIDITATVQANRTIQELNRKMPINMFIISLVAAKKGINPMNIMAQLGNSFYSNYNGFNTMVEEDDMKLPSHFINSYDWNEIELMHKDKEDRATSKLLDMKLSKFFKENDIRYDGNALEAIRQLEARLRGETVPEIVDIDVIEVSVDKEETDKIKTKRELLKEILDSKKKKIE